MSQRTFHARRQAGAWHVHCFFLRDFDMNAHRSTRGFSLVEMLITVLVLGMVIAFSVPAFQSFGNTNRLHGATENLAANMRVLREKAMATGQCQTLHFTVNFPPPQTWDYHVHNGVVTSPGWSLPSGVTATAFINPVFKRDGRVYTDCASATPAGGIVVLRNARGERDTVNILSSGLIVLQ
jgi:prepilin-type N-terminal cleavage/methylation domain-containing protein